MLPTMRGSLLAAGAALALLPLHPQARAGELGDEDTCSRADAHATQPRDRQSTRFETAEAALAFEATRALPAVEPAVADGAAGGMPAATAAGTHEAGAAPAEVERDPHGLRGDADAMHPPAAPATQLRDAPGRTDPEHDGAPPPLAFRDSDAPREKARDLRRWRELKVLRVFDTRELMVWLGLDRKGRPGLHFRQRNPGEEMPPPAQAAFLAEPPPLRSVPLSSP